MKGEVGEWAGGWVGGDVWPRFSTKKSDVGQLKPRPEAPDNSLASVNLI